MGSRMSLDNLASPHWIPDEKLHKEQAPEVVSAPHEELNVNLDIGRLSKAELAGITVYRKGQPASSIFAVLGLWQLCRKQIRLAPPVPSGGYSLWAIDDERSCEIDRTRGISLMNAFRVVRDSGVATLESYPNTTGTVNPCLSALMDANTTPFFRFFNIGSDPYGLVEHLRAGRGFVFAWLYCGFEPQLAPILDQFARIARRTDTVEEEEGDTTEWTTAVIVGYAPMQRLFYGYTPASDLLVAFSSAHISDPRFTASFWTGTLNNSLEEAWVIDDESTVSSETLLE